MKTLHFDGNGGVRVDVSDLLKSPRVQEQLAAVRALRCATEQDCGWQPWCRIEGRCKREPPRGGGES